MTEQEEFEIFDGMNQVNIDMVAKIEASAPICHFRKMFMDTSDSTDGYYETWWECSVCGHTKEI